MRLRATSMLAFPLVFLAGLLAVTGCAPEPEADTGCDWQTPALDSAGIDPPDGRVGELEDIVVGAWQLAQVDDGDGMANADFDGRYVFDDEGFLLCQDKQDEERAEHPGEYEISGDELELSITPYPMTVLAWDEERLLLDNGVSHLLLVRRG